MAQLGGEIICQKDAFLCAAFGTRTDIAFQKKLGVGFFGGEGFILQRLNGDGMAFVHAGGTLIRRDLQAGEVLRVDTGCLVAFSPGIDYDIEMTKGLKSMFFGGEGLFLATLQGTGTVYLQSLPFRGWPTEFSNTRQPPEVAARAKDLCSEVWAICSTMTISRTLNLINCQNHMTHP